MEPCQGASVVLIGQLRCALAVLCRGTTARLKQETQMQATYALCMSQILPHTEHHCKARELRCATCHARTNVRMITQGGHAHWDIDKSGPRDHQHMRLWQFMQCYRDVQGSSGIGVISLDCHRHNDRPSYERDASTATTSAARPSHPRHTCGYPLLPRSRGSVPPQSVSRCAQLAVPNVPARCRAIASTYRVARLGHCSSNALTSCIHAGHALSHMDYSGAGGIAEGGAQLRLQPRGCACTGLTRSVS